MSLTKYDLEERTKRFGENIVRFCRKIPRGPVTDPLITQLVKCGTSTGANYCEADNAESKADFKHKIGICKKESKESQYFLGMVIIAAPHLKEGALVLLQEAKELNLIFNAIIRSANKIENNH